MNISITQVDSLAPDLSSSKAGKELAVLSKWQNIGLDNGVIWGECKGSGSSPYKSQIDTNDFSFKCNCPSRKFPCKHGLGLLYLYIENKDKFIYEMPLWVEEWIKSRSDKKKKKENKKDSTKIIDYEKRAKTEEKRIQMVNEGLNELEIWIQDFIRRGFESIKSESYSFFNQTALRMVDYKAPALSRKIKELSSISSSGKENDILLEKLSKLYLLINAFRNINILPYPMQEDIKSQIGFTKNQDELLNLESVKDEWFIIGCLIEEEDNIKTKKIFIFGIKTKKIAMILDFSVSNKPFTNIDLVSGKSFKGEIIFYPSNLELRAIIKNKEFINSKNIYNYIPDLNIDDVYNLYSQSLVKNPFIEKIPCFIKNIFIYSRSENEFILFDFDNNMIPLNKRFKEAFQAIIFSKNQEFALFGEFNGQDFMPISAFNQKEFNFFSGGK